MDLAEEKAQIRRAIKARRRQLSRAWLEEHSQAIQQRVAAMPEFERAAGVACYLATGAEVRTDRLVAEALRRGKTVSVPAYRRATAVYALARVDARTALKSGPMGVAEPAAPEWVDLDAVDLVLVPGLAFDRGGRRLGYGGGHYDRLLGGVLPVRLSKIGLAFRFQLVERVPAGEYDVQLDAVVTEDRVTRCGRRHDEDKGGVT